MIYLENHFKVSEDYLLLIILLLHLLHLQLQMIQQVQKTIETIFFQEERLKVIMYRLMEEIFMIYELIT